MVAIWGSARLSAHADNTMTDVTATLTTDNRQVGKNDSLGTIIYPKLEKVLANNVVNGQITRRTDTFEVTYSGQLGIGSAYAFKAVYSAVLNPSTIKAGSQDLLAQLGVASNSTNTLNLDGVTATSVLSSSIGNGTGWYLGFNVMEQNQVNGNRVGIAKMPTPVQYPLTPTIDNDPISDSSTVITGKGTFAGDTVSSDASSATAKVGKDLTYQLAVGTGLSGKSNVTVTENSGSTYDIPGTATATVKPAAVLTISSVTPNVQLVPDDVATLTTQSDSDVINWLVKAAGITAIDENTGTSDDITFSSDAADLGTKISQLAADGTLTVPIYATKAGVKSTAVNVTISKSAGSLSFGAVSKDVAFKSTEVPISEVLIPTTDNWNVAIEDTRENGSPWSVYATASKMQSADHELAGNVVYVDGTERTVMTNNSVLIKSGTRQNNTSTNQITSDWSATKGIFLDAQPGVYADSYQGTVDWSLQDTATN